MENITHGELKNLQSTGEKILVQYTAVWCGPCRALTPQLSNLSNKYENIKFVKIDVDQNPDSVMEMEIRSAPTVVIYKGDEIIDRSTGIQSTEHYSKVLNSL